MRVVSVAIFALSCVGAAAINVTAYTTFYGAKVCLGRPQFKLLLSHSISTRVQDNCPPGGAIAYPKIHQLAGGVGTYADPITYASSKKETPPGTIIYVFFLQKYFISKCPYHIDAYVFLSASLPCPLAVEDDCGECDDDWSKHKKYHFDLWTGPDAVTPGPNL